ncbi:MAG: hypothetical protein ABR920_03020 [Terriglobales bacterium]
MKSRQGYKGYVIEARPHELKDGGFSAEFSVEEHDATGMTEAQFYLPNTFSTQESASEAAIHLVLIQGAEFLHNKKSQGRRIRDEHSEVHFGQ